LTNKVSQINILKLVVILTNQCEFTRLANNESISTLIMTIFVKICKATFYIIWAIYLTIYYHNIEKKITKKVRFESNPQKYIIRILFSNK